MKRTVPFTLVLMLIATVATSALELTVVTYNIGLLKVIGSDYVPAVDARARLAPQQLAGFAAQSSPDILLLQEVWRDSYATAISKALAPLGYSSVYPNVHSIIGLGSGLLLAVRAPLRVLDWKFTPFSASTFLESFTRKGVLQATLESPEEGGIRLALIGAHTLAIDTNNGAPKVPKQISRFAVQSAEILSAAEAQSSKGELPLIVLGDLNVGPGYADVAYRMIADAPGMTDVGELLSPGAPYITWDPENPLVKYGGFPNEPPAAIDHILFRDGASLRWRALEARRVLDTTVEGLTMAPSKRADPVPSPLSDHYGLLAKLELGSR